ncbi:MAG: PQQ-dependent sugar dehydrogenase [Colwellia sp.]
MKKHIIILLAYVISFYCQAESSHPMKNTGVDKDISMTLVTEEISIPWAMVQLPSQEILITERSGELRVYKNGRLLPESISGLPKVHNNGQGGLLDIALHPSFEKNHWIYFTYAAYGDAENKSSGSNTALMRATLNITTLSLSEQKLLYQAQPSAKKGQHYGSRIVFDNQNFIYFSVGDRGQRDVNPQNIHKDGGKIYRLHDDGRIPSDNPFLNLQGHRSAVFSYGHRNPQGLSFDPRTNIIWEHEHGPRGGDEVNIITKGMNYGWPVISYGINYNGTELTDKTEMAGMAQPALYWVPSIAPSGLIYISSDKYPLFKGKFLLGSLKFGHLVLLTIENNHVISQEKVFDGIGRARSLMQGIDGFIYVGIDGQGIKKLVPSIKE